jgi:hypothetical protein
VSKKLDAVGVAGMNRPAPIGSRALDDAATAFDEITRFR